VTNILSLAPNQPSNAAVVPRGWRRLNQRLASWAYRSNQQHEISAWPSPVVGPSAVRHQLAARPGSRFASLPPAEQRLSAVPPAVVRSVRTPTRWGSPYSAGFCWHVRQGG
jgi:hypothetical protein